MKRYLYSRFTPSYFWSRIYLLLVLACLTLACLGQMPESSAGWVLPLPQPIYARLKIPLTKGDRRRKERHRQRKAQRVENYKLIKIRYCQMTWHVPVLRTLLLSGGLLILDPKWLIFSTIPYLAWLLQFSTVRYPWLRLQPEFEAFKWIAQLIEQTLMLAITSSLLWQTTSHFLIESPSNWHLYASLLTISGGGSTVLYDDS